MNARIPRPQLPEFFTVVGVRWRRLDARRPWIRWTVIAVVGLWLASDLAGRNAAADDARLSWGETSDVLVAVRDLAPGEGVTAADFRTEQWPAAVRPSNAVESVVTPVQLATALTEGEPLTTSRLLETVDRAGVIVPVPLAADAFHVGQQVTLIDVGDPLAPPTPRVKSLTQTAVVTAVGVDWLAVSMPQNDAPHVAALASRSMISVVAVGPSDAG